MVNADGEWVIAEPDKASWDQYQARAKVSAAAQEAAARGNKALQEKGLECPIDKRLFVEPSKTPCCQTTYCLECVTNALLENDLRCPQCNTENILLDDLKPDEQMMDRIREYEHERRPSQSLEPVRSDEKDLGEERITVKQEAIEENGDTKKPRSMATTQSSLNSKATLTNSSGSTSFAPGDSKDNGSKKRPAASPLVNTRTPPPPGPAAPKQSAYNTSSNKVNTPASAPTGYFGPSQSTMVPPDPNTFLNMPVNMMPSMSTVMGAFDPMMMMNPMMAGNNTDWNATWNGAFSQQPYGTAVPYQSGVSNSPFGAPKMHMPPNNGYTGSNGMSANAMGRGTFSNQQRNHFTGSKANEEDSPYFRKPVNPHRHQARRNINRPADYREI